MAAADIYKSGTRTFRTTMGVFVALVAVSGFLPHRERALLQLEAATGLVARTIADTTFQALPVNARSGGGAVGLAGVPALRVAGIAAPPPAIPAIILPPASAPATSPPAEIVPLGNAGPVAGGGTGGVLGDDAGPTQLASIGDLPGFGGGGGGGGGSISNPADTSTGGTGSTSTGGDTGSTGGTTTSTGGTTTSTGGTTTSTGGTTTSTSTGGDTTSTSTGGDTSTGSTSTGGDVTSTGGTTTSTSTGGVTPVDPVPEPATWVMMILGFGFIGAALRKARRPALA